MEITRNGNKPLAVFKDEKDELHIYSAECTHLGCIVKWNSLEESFDCPCHGSRFAAKTGRIINGPAYTNLEPKDP